VKVIDRKDLITEQDLDDPLENDTDLDTQDYVEDIDELAQFLQYSKEDFNDF